MAITHDSEVLGVANTASGGNYDTAITPTNTPNGVCVIVVNSTAVTDNITSVTYGISTGAVPLTRRRLNTEATEAGGVFVYWGGGVTFPSGAQTGDTRVRGRRRGGARVGAANIHHRAG
jgi:hypothetical protein